jgi:hypothetical protein
MFTGPGRAACFAAGLATAALGAAGASCGPKSIPEHAPAAGSPCDTAGLPRTSGLPRDPRCRVLEATFTKSIAAVIWGDSDTATGGGTVIVDRSSTLHRALSIKYRSEETPWDFYAVRDVTGDGLDDVILRGADYTDADAAPYRIVTRRADGFGDTGVYLLTHPVFHGDGTLSAEHPTSGGREPFTWKFTGHRFTRLAPAETRVSGATATASTALPGHPAAHALDGNWATAWCEAKVGDGVGETLTIRLPSKTTLARFSFATGWDALDGALDRWTANDQILGATLGFDGDVKKRIIMDRGARWVDYIPHDVHETSTITITLENIDKGSATTDSCINEVEIWAR